MKKIILSSLLATTLFASPVNVQCIGNTVNQLNSQAHQRFAEPLNPWLSDLSEESEEPSTDLNSYRGVFSMPPDIIAARLSRPSAPAPIITSFSFPEPLSLRNSSTERVQMSNSTSAPSLSTAEDQ